MRRAVITLCASSMLMPGLKCTSRGSAGSNSSLREASLCLAALSRRGMTRTILFPTSTCPCWMAAKNRVKTFEDYRRMKTLPFLTRCKSRRSILAGT
ncbi:MAG: hypothetical protein MZV64_23540 [Ignavibacteriales bacterium]|nr:hypothetical protein [Ignavibacteriales bacterium]